MAGLQETLAAIEAVAVHQCGYCSEPLAADSESLDYCSDECQAWWLAERHEVQQLVGYREPYELPQHIGNQQELDSPETTPADPDDAEDWHMGYGGTLTFDLHFDTSRWDTAMRRAREHSQACLAFISSSPGGDSAVQRLYEDRQCGRFEDDDFVNGFTPGYVIYDEIHDWQLTGRLPGSYTVYEWSAPKPECEPAPEVFGSDFDFEHRPAASLPDEPPPAVMPDLPSRDWQALVDARVSHTGPHRVVRAPRHLGRTR